LFGATIFYGRTGRIANPPQDTILPHPRCWGISQARAVLRRGGEMTFGVDRLHGLLQAVPPHQQWKWFSSFDP